MRMRIDGGTGAHGRFSGGLGTGPVRRPMAAACLWLAGAVVLGGCAATGFDSATGLETARPDVRARSSQSLQASQAESPQAQPPQVEVQAQSPPPRAQPLQAKPPQALSLQAQPLLVEPIYLGVKPRLVPRADVFRYACRVDEVLTCDCFGRLGNCECQCLTK